MSHRMPRLPANHQEPSERPGTVSPSQPSEGTHTADTMILAFSLQNNGTLLTCKPPAGGTSVRQPGQTHPGGIRCGIYSTPKVTFIPF